MSKDTLHFGDQSKQVVLIFFFHLRVHFMVISVANQRTAFVIEHL